MKKLLYPILLLFITGNLFYCQTNKPKGTPSVATTQEPVRSPEQARIDLDHSPVIPASQSIGYMQVEDGFAVQLVAAEPLVNTPVAMSVDDKGRMWVVEMQGYMPDTLATGEDQPTGKIVILTDRNNDGVADDRTVFLDSLVLPRAICLIEDGILVAEPTNLWYYEIRNDKPGKRTLVDPKYTEGGNVEHQPNGLLRAMDNWIYSANSTKRYRKQGDTWLIEKTHNRGQWGISQDNYGRLYYNDNSINLLGDYFMPGLGATNKNQRNVPGFSERIVTDNRVYPARPTPGVNRGYMKGVLDDSLRLTTFTAACGPVVYRGNLFGSDYAGNVFVAEPSANLIKRNRLAEQGYVTNGTQAYQGREFLSSRDERFRPVSLYNGPDGALYVVDMYRGIIQHKTYLTTYLKGQIARRDLTLPLSCGRIYKIVPKNKVVSRVTLPDKPEELVGLLSHPNGWVRDRAQQRLIDGKHTQVIPALRQLTKEISRPLPAIHAFWTLEGLGALSIDDVQAFAKQAAWPLRMQALGVLPALLSSSTYRTYLPVLEQLVAQNDTLAAPYVAFAANALRPFDKASADRLVLTIAQKYPDNRFVAGAVVSNLQDREEAFKQELTAALPNTDLAVYTQLNRVITGSRNARGNRDPQALARAFPKGAALFSSSCQTCHGADGNGIKALAPPLNQSQWVTGDKDKLIAIVLFGLTGPVDVNGHLYKAPEINGDMPGIGYNKELANEDIAQLLSFIRRSWRNNADRITTEEVASVRQRLKDRQKAFTVAELNGL
ncbi:dehydrogenase [Nibrella saemangeumensis]|uniref:Dehydrogenase n=1 Tax=Nibrella saemangeumensis TaxID=1084526 RepID=A0ABP8MXP3_9BACT